MRKVLILSILAFAANDDLRILLLAAVIALSMMANTVLKPFRRKQVRCSFRVFRVGRRGGGS